MIRNTIIVTLTVVGLMSGYIQSVTADDTAINTSSKAWRDLQQKVDDLTVDQMSFLSFGGLLEIDSVYDREADSVDFSLATLEISLEAEISSWVRGEVVFCYDDDDDTIDVDSAVISIGNTEMYPLFFQVGRMYLPFGNYNSFCITDPLTLELGETRETAGLIGFEYAGLSGSIAVFNGDVETDDKNSVNNFTAALSYTYDNDDFFIALGGSYIYNLNDSDGLQDVVSELEYINEVAGVSAFVSAEFMRVGVSVEYLIATDELAPEFAIEPSALSVDIGYEFNDKIAAALRYDTADEVEDLELPEDRYGACVGWTFNTTDLGTATLSAEYMHEKYADNSDNDLVTLQISFEI